MRRNFLDQKRRTSDNRDSCALFSSLSSGYTEQTFSSCWWFKKRFPLSSRSPVCTRRTQNPHTLKKNRRTQSPHTLKKNRRTQSPHTLKILMRRQETLLTLMTVMIGRRPGQDVVLTSSSCWKQMLMERTVEDQNQAGTRIQIDIKDQILMRRLETLLTLMTVMIGRRPENLSQV
ncbi:uncharacterized protein PEZ65_019135 [Lycodopsis pacificus]